jgi:hypothetical protein
LNNKGKTRLPPRIGRLDSIGAIASELGRLYREARKGEIESFEATRLASILTGLRACLEAGMLDDLQHRLDALEARPASSQERRAAHHVVDLTRRLLS